MCMCLHGIICLLFQFCYKNDWKRHSQQKHTHRRVHLRLNIKEIILSFRWQSIRICSVATSATVSISLELPECPNFSRKFPTSGVSASHEMQYFSSLFSGNERIHLHFITIFTTQTYSHKHTQNVYWIKKNVWRKKTGLLPNL